MLTARGRRRGISETWAESRAKSFAIRAKWVSVETETRLELETAGKFQFQSSFTTTETCNLKEEEGIRGQVSEFH